MSLEQLKKELTDKLLKLDSQTDQYDKMQIAINMKISLKTVERYMTGQAKKLDVAELIIKEAEKVIVAKEEA